MSDEEITDLEGAEEAPLSAEELFELHKAEIDAAFEEKGFFRRLSDMFKGLGAPRSSAEYKLARVELQRLVAPLCAVLLPTLGIIVLIVVTAVTGQYRESIQVDIARAQDDEPELEAEQPPEEIEEQTPPEEVVDVQVDTPTVSQVDVSTPTATPTSEPVSTKPATQDSVALIKSPIMMRSMTGSRTPGSIGKFTAGGNSYGDPSTEAAVLKALRWLKKTQRPNGSWNPKPISNTGLAILAFLAHGETPASKEFGKTVQDAMQFLIDSLSKKKDKTGKEVVTFKGQEDVKAHEYETLIATYALCEAYGMTRNPNTKIVAEQTLQRIVDNQSATGGWDYGLNKSSTRDDVSYGGWALQALKAGKMAGMHPNGLDECIKKAIKCLKTRNFKNGGFNYTAGGRPTGLTATGCLAMQLLGYMNDKEVKEALDFMREWKPSFKADDAPKPGGQLPGHNPQYYCYYATQCKYQAGMCKGATAANVKIWQDWNVAMKSLYTRTITTLPETIPGPDGKPRSIGYWKWVADPTCKGGGDTMTTCLCALQLMVYYRYLPTMQTKAAMAISEPEKESPAKKSNDVEVEVDI
ncbi:MAG: terpene cyclase/mutase family protein [Kiritimatiellae bacterium]|nr:terpene cyclase/mutase family protein [Kiritimatiellia bacterium]